MIRSFRDLWNQISSGDKKPPEDPDLFEYARDQNGGTTSVEIVPEKSSAKRKLLIAALLSFYPLFFGAGYFTNQAMSDCSDLKAALGMIPELGSPEKSSSDAGDLNLTPDQMRFLGVYDAEISGHKASIYLYSLKTGGIGGYMRFKNWGKREIEYLKNLKIVSNRIEFIRSCRAQECVRIGSSSPIFQVYSGFLNQNGRTIEGTYTGGQSASSWTAEKIH